MRRSVRPWVVGAVATLAAALWIAIVYAPRATSAPDRASAPLVAVHATPQRAPAAPGPAALPEAAAPTPSIVPPGVSAEQWAALRAEYADSPHELLRLADHFTFADQLDRFRAGRADGRSAAQRALAQSLDAGLDARLRARELSAAEARLVKIALLDVLLEDDAARRDALGRWEASLAPLPPDPARAAAEADFQRRQAAIVAAWRAQPVAERDPRALESDLQALRESSFSSVQPNPEGVPR